MPTQTLRPLREVAEELAAAHRAVDPETTTIKLFSSPKNDEIRLLEVTTVVPATGEALPYRFPPDPAERIDYPSIVVLLHPAEWRDVEHGALTLPAGWELDSAEDI